MLNLIGKLTFLSYLPNNTLQTMTAQQNNQATEPVTPKSTADSLIDFVIKIKPHIVTLKKKLEEAINN